jgi:hypothetical protein
MNRREFLTTLGRLLAGGALAAIGFKAAGKSPGADAAAACVNQGWCAPCAVSAKCGLPRALSYRRIKGDAS